LRAGDARREAGRGHPPASHAPVALMAEGPAPRWQPHHTNRMAHGTSTFDGDVAQGAWLLDDVPAERHVVGEASAPDPDRHERDRGAAQPLELGERAGVGDADVIDPRLRLA